MHLNPVRLLGRAGYVTLSVVLVAGCSSNPADAPPPTIAPAQAAESPEVTQPPAGEVLPLTGAAEATAFDTATSSLIVLATGPGGGSTVTVFAGGQPATPMPLEQDATALAADGDGNAYLATQGGYYRLDLGDDAAAAAMTRVEIDDSSEVEFTAIGRRDDGRLVLGTSSGAVFTLSSDTAVAARLEIFARVDALVTQGNTAVVLDRGQTSVTSLNDEGTSSEHALRAGEGATTLAADGAGRVLVADTRGGELLVYGVNPLILRQRYPVPDSPYGLAGSGNDSGLAWVAQTATNTVVGYDLATGIPVEKVRYPTVQQPNSLAYDDASDTLYVVSGSGDGVQVIRGASR